jgi:alkylation response protein AidB-like acyl-CoA dehydrogenase
MNLDLTDEQEFFRDTTRKFLEAEVPLDIVRSLYDSPAGFDRGWWRQAAELGWTALFVPEEFGGGTLSGGAVADAVIVAEEMGRLVSPGPFGPVSLVASAVARDGTDEQRAEILPALASGRSIATWALAEPGGRWEPERLDCTADFDGTDIVVSGTKAYVEAAAASEHVLVTARHHGGLTQLLVPTGARGVAVTPGRSVDITRRFGRITFDRVRLPRTAIVGEAGLAGPAVEQQVGLALALQCAELVGVASRTLEFTVEYGEDRYAFGRPVVSFQALKHRIADMTVWMEGAKAVSDELAVGLDTAIPGVSLLARTAKAYVGEHCPDIVDDCVQISGGIGVTWEHDIHLYNRRAVVDRALYGTPEEHKQRIYEHLASEEAPR